MKNLTLNIIHKQGRGSRGGRDEDSGWNLGEEGSWETVLSLCEQREETQIYRGRDLRWNIAEKSVMSKQETLSLKGKVGEAGGHSLRLNQEGLCLLEEVNKDLFDVVSEEGINWIESKVCKDFVFDKSEYRSFLGGKIVILQEERFPNTIYISCKVTKETLVKCLALNYEGFTLSNFDEIKGAFGAPTGASAKATKVTAQD